VLSPNALPNHAREVDAETVMPEEEIEPIRWEDDRLLLLDQTILPDRQEWLTIDTVEAAIEAIREMRVRGAPAIGVAAAYAMVIAARSVEAPTLSTWLTLLDPISARIAAARPTAVNLGWAVQRSVEAARGANSPSEAHKRLLALAHKTKADDVATNRKIGRNGASLVPTKGGILTHCNTGALATAGYGTALGVIRAAWEHGKRPHVFCTETRPWLQGARLTAWELVRMGIPAELVVDSAAAWLMSRHEVNAVIVGADRIAANGDTVNKIGTYSLAVLAKSHNIPFYVAAPTSTVDVGVANGDEIVIEERPPEEVTTLKGQRIAAEGIGVRNPSFDVTPAEYITAIITDQGVHKAPFERALRSAVHQTKAGIV
jgi:methylthioribose-1-phosphate isomerase